MNKMGGRRTEGHITDPRNTRTEEKSRRQRIMEASSEGGPGPEAAVAPQMEAME
jgi:hypothetical protein